MKKAEATSMISDLRQDNLNNPFQWRASQLQLHSSGGEKILGEVCNHSQAETWVPLSLGMYQDLKQSSGEEISVKMRRYLKQ